MAVIFILMVGLIFSLMAMSVFGFVVGAIGLLALAGFQIANARHDTKMKAQRSQLSICDFARDFDTREIDPWVVRFVYEELTDLTGYPIRASDHIYKDLRLNVDDFDIDLEEQITLRLGRDTNGLPSDPPQLETIDDLVMLINALPKVANDE